MVSAKAIERFVRLPMRPERDSNPRIVVLSRFDQNDLEAQAGIEPAHSCFADSRVSTSPLGHFDIKSRILDIVSKSQILTISGQTAG